MRSNLPSLVSPRDVSCFYIFEHIHKNYLRSIISNMILSLILKMTSGIQLKIRFTLVISNSIHTYDFKIGFERL